MEPVLRAADSGEVPVLPYAFGSGGPVEAHQMRVRAGHIPSVYSSVRDARDAALYSQEGFRPLGRVSSAGNVGGSISSPGKLSLGKLAPAGPDAQ